MDIAENSSCLMIFFTAASSSTLSFAPGLQTSTGFFFFSLFFQFWSVTFNSVTVFLKQLWWQRPGDSSRL